MSSSVEDLIFVIWRSCLLQSDLGIHEDINEEEELDDANLQNKHLGEGGRGWCCGY